MSSEEKGIWYELRRRHVVSTAAAYAAVAFVILQLGEILFPAFGLGPSALRAVLALLLAGFPIVVAMSWIFDVTRSGLKRTSATDEDGNALPGVKPPSLIQITLVLVAAALLGGVGWWAVREVESVADAPTGASSIAVLPFADLSEAGDQAYLGDGLAEEILNILSGVDGLQVAARTSAFAFRDGTEDVRQIGEQLNVATLLEGSVRRTGNRVRVTAQLIDTRTGFHLWSSTFDREVENLFAVQDEIATAIVRELLGNLDLPGRRTTRHVASQQAQDAYWKGRAQWGRRDAATIPGAIVLFQEAITIDPEYAEAYAGLADSYALLPLYVPTSSMDEALDQAESWARKAIDLDSTLADPHASLGLVHALRQDRLGALEEFKRAVELNPSYAPAYHWRANVLAEMGQLDGAYRDATRAADLDPLSAAVATDLGKILLWRGDVEGARKEMERALSLDFGYRPALFANALVALQEERPVPLQMALTQWAAVSGAPVRMASELTDAMLAFKAGRPAEAPAALRGLETNPGKLSSGNLAALYALVGSRDDVLRWLRRAASDGSWAEQYLAVNPVYEPFRNDPAFREILSELAS